MFNAKGKFIRYEKRESEEDNPAIMQPLDDAISTQSHNRYCNWKCGIWISLLLITFAVVIAIIFYTGEKVGESRGQSEESKLQSSKHTHTYPKKEHSCRNCPPTSSPVVDSISDPIINRPFKPGQTKPGESSGSVMTEITPWSEGGDIRIGASSVSTTMRSNPDYRWGVVKELSVESDEQISYIRFDLSSINRNRFMSGSVIDLDISKVILWLYMITHQDEEDLIKVDMLPAAGRWEDSSVSWNNPPDAKDAFYVDSFVAKGVEVGLVLIQVDVTPAFISSLYDTAVTFKLYTEPTSNGVYSFASRDWEEGESIPELVVTMSA